MAGATEYLSIEEASSAEFKDRGSRFLAFAIPADDEEHIKVELNALKEKYPDATHHCYAWVLGADRSRYRSNDDGEPNHSAGTPILRQIHSFDLTQVLVVVVRYYGGTNLGVPGLIHAYGHATRLALEASSIQVKRLRSKAVLRFPFGEDGNAYRMVNHVQAEVKELVYTPDPELHIQFDLEKKEELEILAKNFPNIEMLCE